jgi:hypothetical protein
MLIGQSGKSARSFSDEQAPAGAPVPARVEYEPVEDKTKLAVRLSQRRISADHDIDLQAYAVGKGKAPSRWFFAQINAVSTSDRWEFLETRSAAWLVDGERWTTTWDSHSGHTKDSGGVMEHLWFDLSRDQMQKIAKAKSAAFRVSVHTITLSPTDQRSLAVFLATLDDPAKLEELRTPARRWTAPLLDAAGAPYTYPGERAAAPPTPDSKTKAIRTTYEARWEAARLAAKRLPNRSVGTYLPKKRQEIIRDLSQQYQMSEFDIGVIVGPARN